MESRSLNNLFLVIFTALFLCACGASDERLIRTAIQHSYPNIYDDLSELRKDYPYFTPEVKAWGGITPFIFGKGRYYVTLPEEAVILSSEGKFETSRSCLAFDARQPLCVLATPKVAELGIVGTIQIDEENYPPAEDFTIKWIGLEKGEVFIKGHCFYAYKRSDEPLVLSIQGVGYKPIQIKNIYGTRVVAVTLSHNNYYGTARIPKSLFHSSNTCSPETRALWPNVGGRAWIR